MPLSRAACSMSAGERLERGGVDPAGGGRGPLRRQPEFLEAASQAGVEHGLEVRGVPFDVAELGRLPA